MQRKDEMDSRREIPYCLTGNVQRDKFRFSHYHSALGPSNDSEARHLSRLGRKLLLGRRLPATMAPVTEVTAPGPAIAEKARS
jgi:hypothetical protein